MNDGHIILYYRFKIYLVCMIIGENISYLILSGMDKVKQLFATKMHASVTKQLQLTSTPCKDRQINESNAYYTSIFNCLGRALLVRSNFRFTAEQKEFLVQEFLKGEETGERSHQNK